MFGILRNMTHRPPDERTRAPRILFSVRMGQSFPAELWQQFLAICDRKGETWIVALRRIVHQYVKSETTPPAAPRIAPDGTKETPQ